jgi:hypothetical protein
MIGDKTATKRRQFLFLSPHFVTGAALGKKIVNCGSLFKTSPPPAINRFSGALPMRTGLHFAQKIPRKTLF